MICNLCKANNTEGSQFCMNCGRSLDTVSLEETSSIQAAETTAELPMVEFGEAIKRAISNYFNFRGRATRAEYWWFFLAMQVINLISLLPIIGWIISALGTLFVIIPSISLGARRLHDIGRTGWWQLAWVGILFGGSAFFYATLVAAFGIDDNQKLDSGGGFFVVGLMVLLLVNLIVFVWWLIWFCKKGDLGPNKHGPDPRYFRES